MKITIAVKENGSIKVEYPKDVPYMSVIGVIESGKGILINEYINPQNNGSIGVGLSQHDGKTLKTENF